LMKVNPWNYSNRESDCNPELVCGPSRGGR
jgi:hypothetical protein